MSDNFSENFIEWAQNCVKIEDKLTGALVPFRLNRPQRRVLEALETQRRRGRPIRIILLKARQWGGSTLIQIYMAWMQLVRHNGWNSVICAHVKDAAAGIRGMYSRLLREYPDDFKTGKGKDWVLSPYEKSQSVVEIAPRGCRITLATAGAPNSVRGASYAMAHLSEVAFWADGDREVAEGIVRTVCGSVPRVADSLIVMESTANGRNNYFHDEWQRAASGRSDKVAVFVPWHEIEIYSREVPESEREEVLAALDDYERRLLADGVALENVAWYHDKRREYPTHEAMMAEFPSTAEEAFSASSADAPFTEEWIPPLKGESDEGVGSTRMLVAVPAHDRHLRALEIVDISDGSLTGRRSLPAGATLADMLSTAVGWCERRDAPLVVAVADDSDDAAHAAWFAGKAVEAGIDIIGDDDENDYHVLTRQRLVGLIDLYRDDFVRHRIAEIDSSILGDYRDFRLNSPGASPRVLARLAALHARHTASTAIRAEELL